MSLGWKKRYITLVENTKMSTYDRPFLSMVSDEEIRVENHQGIVEYTSSEVVIKTLKFFVKVVGENLSIDCLTREDVSITGKIKSVDFEMI